MHKEIPYEPPGSTQTHGFFLKNMQKPLPLYQKLHAKDPGNDKLNYKIGICLLNDPYQKDKAIQYLLDASENINPDYKENSVK